MNWNLSGILQAASSIQQIVQERSTSKEENGINRNDFLTNEEAKKEFQRIANKCNHVYDENIPTSEIIDPLNPEPFLLERFHILTETCDLYIFDRSKRVYIVFVGTRSTGQWVLNAAGSVGIDIRSVLGVEAEKNPIEWHHQMITFAHSFLEIVLNHLDITGIKVADYEFIFAGHSRGGALACYTSVVAKETTEIKNIKYVVTFGSAPVHEALNTNIVNIYRVYRDADPVPMSFLTVNGNFVSKVAGRNIKLTDRKVYQNDLTFIADIYNKGWANGIGHAVNTCVETALMNHSMTAYAEDIGTYFK